jgi:uncharacterized protein YbaP (TraB family)
MKIIALLMLGLLAPAIHAANDAAVPAVAQAASAPQRGTLYRVRDHDRTVYLFGTIHVGEAGFYPLEDGVMQALTQAARLVVELDVRDADSFQAALHRHGTYPSGDSAPRHLSPAAQQELGATLARFGIPLAQVERFKPWLLANMLAGLDLERSGYERAQGLEYFLLTAAQQQAKTVQELESADYQMALFAGMDDAEQEQYLRETLAELNDGTARQNARRLVDAWSHADSKSIEQMLREETREDTTKGRLMRRVILGKRNPEMAGKIEAYMKSEGTTFVGVGLLHLVGEDGVPKLLQQRGYEVEKLY